MNPSSAVIMKFDEVFRIETWVVEVPRARALVKRVHMMPLKIRLRPKNICFVLALILPADGGRLRKHEVFRRVRGHTARTTTSTPFSRFERPRRLEMEVAKVVVSSVVVLRGMS